MTPTARIVEKVAQALYDGMNAPTDEQAATAITAHLEALEAEGWVLRPVEATEAMMDAAWEAPPDTNCVGPLSTSMRVVWDAMCAAAPKPPGAGA